jgi:hypothetical protein
MKGERRQGIEDLCTPAHDQIERDLKQHWAALSLEIKVGSIVTVGFENKWWSSTPNAQFKPLDMIWVPKLAPSCS